MECKTLTQLADWYDRRMASGRRMSSDELGFLVAHVSALRAAGWAVRYEDGVATVLEQHHWRMSDAARTLGIERANLYRKTRQLGITRGPRAELS